MDDRFVITELDQLKAMADPMRVRLVEALTHRELTVAELAKRVGEPIGRLYHHVDLLLAAGLVVVTRRVKKRGTEERWLRSVARDIVVDDGIFAVAPPSADDPGALVDLARSFFVGLGDDLAQAAHAGAIVQTDPARRVFLEQQELGLTAAQYQELCRTLDRWIDEAKAASRPKAAARYRVAVTMFPLAASALPKRRR
jgi:DNA-binding transcriptional ArsR family regulator